MQRAGVGHDPARRRLLLAVRAARRSRTRSISLAGVFGRNDGDHAGAARASAARRSATELFESPHSFEIGGRAHAARARHRRRATSARSTAHEIVIHGCTHQQEMKTRGDTLIVNPGEACGWLYGTPSAAMLDLDDDERRVPHASMPAEWNC